MMDHIAFAIGGLDRSPKSYFSFQVSLSGLSHMFFHLSCSCWLQVKRKKASHAGMFDIAKTANRPMIHIGG